MFYFSFFALKYLKNTKQIEIFQMKSHLLEGGDVHAMDCSCLSLVLSAYTASVA